MGHDEADEGVTDIDACVDVGNEWGEAHYMVNCHHYYKFIEQFTNSFAARFVRISKGNYNDV